MAMMVEIKVMVMERLRSPLKSNVQKLLPLPPGEHPRVNSPRRCRGSSSNSHPVQKENCTNGDHGANVVMERHIGVG